MALLPIARADWQPTPFAILSFWMVAFFLARGMTIMAERLFAAPGAGGWRVAAPLFAMLTLVGQIGASFFQ